MPNWIESKDWSALKPGQRIRVEHRHGYALEGTVYGHEYEEQRVELHFFQPKLTWMQGSGVTLWIELDDHRKLDRLVQ